MKDDQHPRRRRWSGLCTRQLKKHIARLVLTVYGIPDDHNDDGRRLIRILTDGMRGQEVGRAVRGRVADHGMDGGAQVGY